MKFVDNLREKPAVKKIEKFAPAIAFLGGFGWDSITLGQMVESSDLVFLVAYYTGALILVILLSARLEHPEGWTKDRIRAVAASQARPVAPQAKPATATAKAPSATIVAKKVAPQPTTAPAKGNTFGAMANRFVTEQAKVVQNQAKEAAEKAAEKAREAAGKASAAAERFAKNMGYESTAIPANAIIVEHHFLDREWSPVWRQRFSWAVQFCFGSLFSALVVCYFKSSGSLASFILVILLAILLVGNEFLQKKYESFGVSLAFLSLLGTMFMNFTLPHLVHRIGFIWFFLSTLLSLAVCVLLWKISRRSKKVLIAPIGISVCLVVAYLMNWVPPVPLVLKQQLVCQNFDKTDYSCDVDAPSILQTIGLQMPSIHRIPGEDVYVLASVYAPASLKAEIEYRWHYMIPNTAKYTLTDKISSGRMVINGGREDGFRSFSRKKNIPAGKYRVEVAFKDGAVIGSQTFEVIDEARDSTGYVRKQLQ